MASSAGSEVQAAQELPASQTTPSLPLVPSLRPADDNLGLGLASFEVVEIADEKPSQPSRGYKKVKFDGGAPRLLRTDASLVRKFPHHRIEGGDFRAPIMCLGAGCPLCAAKKKYDPDRAPY